MRRPKVMHNGTIHKFVIPQAQLAGFDLQSEFEFPVGIDKLYKISGIIKLDRKIFPDILVCYDGFILAVIEVKPVDETEWCGFEQAFKYANELGVRLAISTNGKKYIVFDTYTRKFLYDDLDYFPPHDELIGMCSNFMREAPSLNPINMVDIFGKVNSGEKRLDEIINLFGFPMCEMMGVAQYLKKKEIHPSIRKYRDEGLIHLPIYMDSYFKMIEDLMRFGHYQTALDCLEKKQGPKLDQNYLKILRTICWIHCGKFDEMAHYLKTWLEGSSVLGELYNIIAEELIACGCNGWAYMYLEKREGQNAEDSRAKELMAIIHYNWRDYESSLSILNELIKQERSPDRICLLGKCLFFLGEVGSPIKIFAELLSLNYSASEMSKNIDVIKEVMLYYRKLSDNISGGNTYIKDTSLKRVSCKPRYG